MASIQIRGIDELQRKLGNAAANRTLMRPMQQSTRLLQRKAAENPPPPAAGEWAAWVNSHSPAKAAQIRGAYFARVREAGRHPGRTGASRKWTVQITPSAAGLTGKVGNNADHIPWVRSSKFQAGFHAGRWPTDADLIEDNENQIRLFFQRAIDRALEGK